MQVEALLHLQAHRHCPLLRCACRRDRRACRGVFAGLAHHRQARESKTRRCAVQRPRWPASVCVRTAGRPVPPLPPRRRRRGRGSRLPAPLLTLLHSGTLYTYYILLRLLQLTLPHQIVPDAKILLLRTAKLPPSLHGYSGLTSPG